MASEKNLGLKNSTVKEIKDKISNSKSLVIVDYRGIPVSGVSELRKELRKTASDIRVYKNTLVKRALDELGYDLSAFLEGPNAFVFGNEIIEPIKAVNTFGTKNKNLEIRTGIIDGKIVTAAIIKEYATIPSYEGLLSMFAGGLMEHVRTLAIGFDLYAKKLEEETN